MRDLTARWLSVACCAALAAACGRSSNPATGSARTARAAATVSGTGPAQLVADLHPGSAPVGSFPHGFIASGSTAFFAADDGSSGYELWKTQGVPGDPVLVADIRPGGGSSLPSSGPVQGVAWNGGLLFAADDGSRGTELWFSDGTAAGTRLVKDLEPGTGSSSPRSFTVVGSKVFFAATTSANGEELWVTDGTAGGTSLVLDIDRGYGGINPGASSSPEELTAVGSTLYFTADDGAVGRELWRSDGTAAGTSLVMDISAGSDAPTHLVAFQGRLFFTDVDANGNRVLWSSTGTAAGTAPVGVPTTAQADPDALTPVGASLYFTAGPATGREVWAWDTSLARYVARTIRGTTPSDPVTIAASNGIVYASLVCSATVPCAGSYAQDGRELYAWNGFAWQLLADIAPGAFDSNPTLLTDVAGTLYFGATGTGSATLWRTDGTAAGTQQVDPALAVREIGVLSNAAIFSGEDAGVSGAEPWIVIPAGGTSASRLLNVHPDLGSSTPQSLTAWNGQLLFSADDGVNGRQLWVVNPAVQPLGASLATDAYQNVGNFSDPQDLVDAGGALLFTANGLFQGRELRAYPSADPTFLVTDLAPGAASAIRVPGWLTRLGANVLFVADDGSGLGSELWRTDGTAAGTALVQDVWPGPTSSFPGSLVAIGGNVWFVAADGGASDGNTQAKAFRSDGTAAGTVPVDLLGGTPGEFVFDPTWFSSFGTSVVFSAVNTTQNLGRALFVWDPGTNLVRSITAFGAPTVGTPDPVGFTTLGTAGYFGVRDSTDRGYALWKTDGYDSGTTKVAPIGTLGGGRYSSPIVLGGKLWFVGNDDVHGDELWVSDGTPSGTKMLVDGFPGAGGALDGSALFPLPARGEVLFAADDGASGRELWISDGTVLGTRLLHDIWPGPGSSNPADFTAVGDLVFFTADDGSTGRELWVLDTSVANLDLTPPVPVCPAQPVVYEATGPAGADPVLAISASDDRGGPVTVTFDPASGSPFSFGITPVLATATDASGNRAQCGFDVLVQDTTPPTLGCPGDLSLEATSAAGATAVFVGTTAASAVDAVTATPSVTYAPASGSTFPLGPGKAPLSTPVLVTAWDASNNTTTCTFHVNVADTTPPSVTCPAAVTVEATGPAGATASWGAATATDAVSPQSAIAITFDATPLASVFPLGTSTVHALARDEAGNVGTCPFGVTVRDTTAPSVACPADVVVEATSPSGASASFAATASDTVNPSPGVLYDPAPAGTWTGGQQVSAAFPYGTTTVRATAWDGYNLSAPCQFLVTVRDTTPPAVTCPAPVTAEATGALGAPVPLAGLATATDVATATPSVAYAALGAAVSATGWVAPLGSTGVTATATDRAGNTASCTFPVTVVDTTPPRVTCPADFAVDAASAAGSAVAFVSTTAASATDLVTAAPGIAYAPASGSLLPVGAGGAPYVSTVTATATDVAGNAASCTFHVTVADVTPPVPLCPGDLTYEATGPAGATVAAWVDASGVPTDATGLDAVTPAFLISPAHGLVTYAPGPGSVFPLGATPVTATVSDAAQNRAACAFQVHVVDTTPPAITCPSPAPVEATGNGGADVEFVTTATDAVTLAPAVAYDGGHGPGTFFALGTTHVTATATDAAGNPASCQFDVEVVDHTPPTIVCPGDRQVPGNGSVAVFFPAPAVSDAGTPSPAVTSTHRSGDVFPLGDTPVTFTATDASGNAASCTMTVSVHPTPFEGGGGCSTGSGGAVALLGLGAALLRRRRRP